MPDTTNNTTGLLDVFQDQKQNSPKKIEHIPKAGNSIKPWDLQIFKKNQNSKLVATPATRSIISFGYDTNIF